MRWQNVVFINDRGVRSEALLGTSPFGSTPDPREQWHGKSTVNTCCDHRPSFGFLSHIVKQR